ncbi:hypothetical protein BX661DRAFT_187072 [Kickxella alabastrina]|uniref:uncharacterized protein n=1 Tax=Kickxella alabastrina TaxID=61397 RepID=UPI002220B969|nr:uncharacterized protein BX661DRAFT_187072 [Kickxella alabastrina]KAI7822740.1 hypothetical protein BX661DRAFT_187072 [Kickxella alabastrina]
MTTAPRLYSLSLNGYLTRTLNSTLTLAIWIAPASSTGSSSFFVCMSQHALTSNSEKPVRLYENHSSTTRRLTPILCVGLKQITFTCLTCCHRCVYFTTRQSAYLTPTTWDLRTAINMRRGLFRINLTKNWLSQKRNRIPSRGKNTSKKHKATSRRTNTSNSPSAIADNDSTKNSDKKRRIVKCSACSGRHYKKTGCDASVTKRGPLPTAN